jgi:hypothetical protein
MAAIGAGTGETFVGYIESFDEPITWHFSGSYYDPAEGFDLDAWDLVVEVENEPI